MDKTFTLYWQDGKREFVTGPDIAKACTLAGYSNGAMAALDWYDNNVSETHVYIKENDGTGRWVKRGPVFLDYDRVADAPFEEIVRLLKTSSKVNIKLRNQDRIIATLRYGQFATLGWVKYIEIFYGERIEGEIDGEVAFNVHSPAYFDPTDFGNAIEYLRSRVASAHDNSRNAISIGKTNAGLKSLDEIKASQKEIPL